MNHLALIRKLPEGTQGRAIAAAHRIADARNIEANGQGAQYASLRILYYDSETWERAYLEVTA